MSAADKPSRSAVNVERIVIVEAAKNTETISGGDVDPLQDTYVWIGFPDSARFQNDCRFGARAGRGGQGL
jgi:hypothetical protein